MPAYNFKSIFAHAVEHGEKYTTIRQVRKNPTEPGDILYLYTGLRTKYARLLRTEKCVSITPVIIDPVEGFFVNGRLLNMEEKYKLAEIDTAGLWTYTEFYNFFKSTYGLPFRGELITWEPFV